MKAAVKSSGSFDEGDAGSPVGSLAGVVIDDGHFGVERRSDTFSSYFDPVGQGQSNVLNALGQLELGSDEDAENGDEGREEEPMANCGVPLSELLGLAFVYLLPLEMLTEEVNHATEWIYGERASGKWSLVVTCVL